MSSTQSELTHEQIAALQSSSLFNADLAPVPASGRKWRLGSFAALWISMSACIPTYMLASSLIGGGMNWWQAILTIFLGNLIVLIPMVLNAHAGTHYGIPFPVYCRASFGTRGANIPALLRALVACGWFGIQTWIGGNAIDKILSVFLPSLAGTTTGFLGITSAQFVCFLFFWGINMLVVYKGINCIRWLLNIKAPLLIALGLLLLLWAYQRAGGFGPILSQPSAFAAGQPKSGQFWFYFFPALTGMIGFWATLSLNIPDFSRYAVSQRDQILGQALGPRRKHIVLATKFGLAMDDAGKLRGASRRYIVQAVEASLKRLKTDWIDLYQLHRPDVQTPIEETLRALDDLVKSGKVRAIGCSNLSAAQLAEALTVAERNKLISFVTAQDEYSLLERGLEKDRLPAMRRHGVTLLPYFPLASGLLTGKYKRNAPMPAGTRLARNPPRGAGVFINARNWGLVGRSKPSALSAATRCLSSP